MRAQKTSRPSFGRALRTARLLRRLAQEHLEPVASQRYISLLETDQKSPTLKMIDALARKLRLHPGTLTALTYMQAQQAKGQRATLKRIVNELDQLLDLETVKKGKRPRGRNTSRTA